MNSPVTDRPVSSANSRLAASSGTSSGSNSPLGIDQAPRSFLAQKGPPICATRTSTIPRRRRYINIPALFLAILLRDHPGYHECIEHHDEPDQGRERDAVFEDGFEDRRFVSDLMCRSARDDD